MILKWNSINADAIDEKSGVYAWYYDVTLGDYDIETLIEKILLLKNNNREKKITITQFLEKHFFHFFREERYVAKISGKLMPTFQGELNHIDQISDEMINHLLENPSALWEVKEALSSFDESFSSPIYIGMSDNLCHRVNRHKQLIEKFRLERTRTDDFTDRDENFAARVIARGMNETKLKVAVRYISTKDRIHGFTENLLNRINYPVLGRN